MALATSMESTFADEAEILIWRRKWLGLDPTLTPHKGYLVFEPGVRHAWIWVLTGDGSMRRRVVVCPDEAARVDERLKEFPIALQFRISITTIGETDTYQLYLAEAFAPSTSVRTANTTSVAN